jgi:hypothetical protein
VLSSSDPTSHQCLLSFFPVLPVPCNDNDGSGRPAHMTVHRVLVLDRRLGDGGDLCDATWHRRGRAGCRTITKVEIPESKRLQRELTCVTTEDRSTFC